MRRLLVVGLPNSVHLHRWIRAAAKHDCTILVFPSLVIPDEETPPFPKVSLAKVANGLPPGIFFVSGKEARSPEAEALDKQWHYVPRTHHFVSAEALSSADRLLAALAAFQPEVLHSMETQIAGYLVSEARRRKPFTMPWIHSTWGSDMVLYGRMPGHERSLRDTFRHVDFHLADTAADRVLARQFGYAGPDLPVLPASGGIEVERVAALAKEPPSRRRRIIVKGGHNWAGRNLLALSAVVMLKDRLEHFEVVIPNADPAMQEWAAIIANRTSLRIRALRRFEKPDDVLRQMADARAVVSLSHSDGLPMTVLEAMALGAFPIQSRAGSAADWFVDGQGGLSVDMNDTGAVAAALLRAVTDDALVDQAAKRNLETIRRGWDISVNAAKIDKIYRDALRSVARAGGTTGIKQGFTV
jgi:glycosyltransferase involved in cell wall biosynthesis